MGSDQRDMNDVCAVRQILHTAGTIHGTGTGLWSE